MKEYLSRREQEKKEKGKDSSLDEVWFYRIAEAVAAWENSKRMWFYKRIDLPSLPLGCLVVRFYQHDMQFISGMSSPSLGGAYSLCPIDVAEKLERLYRTQYIAGLLDLQHLGKYQRDGAITTRFTRSCFFPIKEACQETGIWDDGGYYAQV
jgi:hypothetical protein